MRAPVPLRPELASVLRYVAVKRGARLVRPCRPESGILAELASGQGLQ